MARWWIWVDHGDHFEKLFISRLFMDCIRYDIYFPIVFKELRNTHSVSYLFSVAKYLFLLRDIIVLTKNLYVVESLPCPADQFITIFSNYVLVNIHEAFFLTSSTLSGQRDWNQS